MRIGEVAERAGLRTSAIRFYERAGLLPTPARDSGRRRYREDVLLRLQVIRFARESGFTLAVIRRLVVRRRYSRPPRRFALQKIGELYAAIERARAMQELLERALRCKCLAVEECGRRMKAPP